jgi:hypothetical protein
MSLVPCVMPPGFRCTLCWCLLKVPSRSKDGYTRKHQFDPLTWCYRQGTKCKDARWPLTQGGNCSPCLKCYRKSEW